MRMTPIYLNVEKVNGKAAAIWVDFAGGRIGHQEEYVYSAAMHEYARKK